MVRVYNEFKYFDFHAIRKPFRFLKRLPAKKGIFMFKLFGKKIKTEQSVKSAAAEPAHKADNGANQTNTAAHMKDESVASMNDGKAYLKPSGYQEMTFDELKLYYRSEEVDYSSLSDQGNSRFMSYGLEHDRDITDSWRIFRNKTGLKALVIHVSVPTFDSGDRQWDSYRELFLIPKEQRMTGFMVCGGYEIAKILAYNDVRCADEKTEKLLKGTGIF